MELCVTDWLQNRGGVVFPVFFHWLCLLAVYNTRYQMVTSVQLEWDDLGHEVPQKRNSGRVMC